MRSGRAVFAGSVVCVAVCVAAGCGTSASSGGGAVAADAAPPEPRATGALGDWATLAPMPAPRGNLCAVAAKGWLVVVGGNAKPAGASSFVSTANVHSARIAADGSLGPWQLAGKTPSPVSACTAAASGDDVWLVDGIYDDAPSDATLVRRATLGDDGTLGAWQDAGRLPAGVRVLSSTAWVKDGALYAFQDRLPDGGDDVALLRLPIEGGEVGAPKETTIVKGFRGHPQHAVLAGAGGDVAYALGGYGSADAGNAVLASGAALSLDASRAVAVAALPRPTAFGQAVAVDDWVFVVGGKDEVLTGKGRVDVFAAKAAPDGTIDAWAPTAPLPQGRTAHAVVVAGDFLYVLGGGYDAGGLDTVFAARVRFAPPSAAQ